MTLRSGTGRQPPSIVTAYGWSAVRTAPVAATAQAAVRVPVDSVGCIVVMGADRRAGHGTERGVHPPASGGRLVRQCLCVAHDNALRQWLQPAGGIHGRRRCALPVTLKLTLTRAPHPPAPRSRACRSAPAAVQRPGPPGRERSSSGSCAPRCRRTGRPTR